MGKGLSNLIFYMIGKEEGKEEGKENGERGEKGREGEGREQGMPAERHV